MTIAEFEALQNAIADHDAAQVPFGAPRVFRSHCLHWRVTPDEHEPLCSAPILTKLEAIESALYA